MMMAKRPPWTLRPACAPDVGAVVVWAVALEDEAELEDALELAAELLLAEAEVDEDEDEDEDEVLALALALDALAEDEDEVLALALALDALAEDEEEPEVEDDEPVADAVELPDEEAEDTVLVLRMAN
jgi:hypothetical protein